MAGILRGEIVWAELDPTLGREQAGHRPVLVISHDVFNERSGTVIAMAITSQPQRAGFPLSVELGERKSPEALLGQNQSDSHSFHPAAGRESRSGLTRGARAVGRGSERNCRRLIVRTSQIRRPPDITCLQPAVTSAASPAPSQRWPSVRQAGSKTRLPSVLPAVAMPTMVPKFTNGSNSLARSARKPIATAMLESMTPGPLTR